jgi:hypothetical protein
LGVADVLAGNRSWHVEIGDALSVLRSLPGGVVQCCVTSPPYYGLRDYGVEGQIGLEGTPAAFVARLVEVFTEMRRVLRDDGTCWVNLGDSYVSGGGRAGNNNKGNVTDKAMDKRRIGLKHKDRIGSPHQFVFAARDDGWHWRDEIVWHKPAPMPESVTDRTTKAHEFVFLENFGGQTTTTPWVAIGGPSGPSPPRRFRVPTSPHSRRNFRVGVSRPAPRSGAVARRAGRRGGGSRSGYRYTVRDPAITSNARASPVRATVVRTRWRA